MAELEVREARAADRAAVSALCARSSDGGDFVDAAWDQWLGDPNGALLVGVVSDAPVGVVHVRLVSSDEGWIDGLRVDPEWRRQGIGRVMLSRALAAAAERGAHVVRLFTLSNNIPAQELFARFGFVQVASFVSYEAPAAPLAAGEAVPPGMTYRTPIVGDLERLWTFLEASNLVPLNGGLMLEEWWARALTSTLLEQRLAGGDVRVLEAWDAVQALAIFQRRGQSKRGPQLVVQYLDGATEGIGRMALALRAEAQRMGLSRVTLTVPDLLILHDAMDGAGYARRGADAIWCFARQLSGQ